MEVQVRPKKTRFLLSSLIRGGKFVGLQTFSLISSEEKSKEDLLLMQLKQFCQVLTNLTIVRSACHVSSQDTNVFELELPEERWGYGDLCSLSLNIKLFVVFTKLDHVLHMEGC